MSNLALTCAAVAAITFALIGYTMHRERDQLSTVCIKELTE